MAGVSSSATGLIVAHFRVIMCIKWDLILIIAHGNTRYETIWVKFVTYISGIFEDIKILHYLNVDIQLIAKKIMHCIFSYRFCAVQTLWLQTKI